MNFEFSGGRRSAGIIALAVVAGIVVSQIVLVLTAGSLGIPGIFAIHLDGEQASQQEVATEASKGTSVTRTTPPPIATPAPSSDDEPTASPVPSSEQAEEGQQSAPAAQSAGETANGASEATPPSGPRGTAETEAEPQAPATGPLGWQGPEGAPGDDGNADDEAVLDGPIDLNVGDALSDLNREEAEEEKEEKNGEGSDNAESGPAQGPASSAQPAPPPAPGASGKREVLPWEAIVPDPELMAPVEVPEDTPEFSLPAPDVVKGWLQGRSSNAASGDTRYELWLEPSMDMRLRLTAVGYQFKPAGGDMITRLSRKPESGFRVSYEAPSCEGNITLTLTYKDGRSHKVPLDGCGSFN